MMLNRSGLFYQEMGELHPPASAPDPMYRTKVFMEFTIDSVDIDVMAGFSIVSEGKVYDCSLDKEQIVERMTLGTEVIPLPIPYNYGVNTIG